MVRPSSTAGASASSLPSWARVIHKGQPTDALLKRLKTLRKTLSDAEQDGVQVRVLDHVRKQLGEDDIIFHKNKDVRSTLACCHAELLRLYAPDCPYSDDELFVNFTFFLYVLTSSSAGLGKPSGSTFADCIALLSQLVATRAFALLCDRGISDKLVGDYFKSIFSVVKPNTPKNVEILLSEALGLFLQYGNAVPSDVVEMLIANFHPLVKQHNPAAAHLAQLVGNAAADELQTAVAQYFAEGILQAAQVVDEEERESKLHAIHLLITQIAKSSPALLCNVIPQLEEEMRAEDVRLRLVSVRTLGIIFADRTAASGSAVGREAMTKKYQSTWKMWLGRAWDKSNAVRIAWVESIKGLLVPDITGNTELMSYVEQKLTDPDDKVRSAMVKTFATLDYAILRSHVPLALMQVLGDRAKDKRYHIRIDALHALGRAYNLAYPDMSSSDSAALKQFAWIPSVMMSAALAAEKLSGMPLALQAAFETHILPLPKVAQEATGDAMLARLCFVLQHFDDESAHAFDSICNVRGIRSHLHAFIQACKDFNGGVVEATQAEGIQKALLRSIGLLANQFVDPLKAGQDLHAWAKQNDNRAFKLLETVMNPSADLKTIIKVRAELDMRLNSERTGVTMLAFVRMASFAFVNSSTVPGLLGVLADETDTERGPQQTASKLAARVFRLLKVTASECPAMLKNHIDMFRTDLQAEDIPADRRAASIMALAKMEASGTSGIAEKLTDGDVEELARVAENGSWKEAKWAAKLLAHVASNVGAPAYATAFHQAERLCTSFVETSLNVQDPVKLVSTILALRQITKRARDAMSDSGDRIIELLLENVLMQPYEAESKSTLGLDWIENEDLDAQLSARLEALRFLTDRCIAYADHEESEEIARPVLRLLVTCMTTGETAPGLCQVPAAMARLRLQSSLQLLKLARKSVFDHMISVQDFQLLSRVLQDVIFTVRHQVLRNLVKNMLKRSSLLPARFYALAFIVACDPDDETRMLVRESCTGMINAMRAEYRLRYFDASLARFIHLLNHHPDCENTADSEEEVRVEKLKQAATYIEFFLDCCATRDNLACLHYIAHRCKGMRDVFDEDRKGAAEDDGVASQGIHTLSDLCMSLIRCRAELFGTTIGDWQGQVGMPRDLYTPYTRREEQHRVLTRSYLRPEELELLQQYSRRERAAIKTSASKRKKATSGFAEQKEAKRSKGGKGHASKPSKSRKANYQSDDGAESDSEAVTEDDDENDSLDDAPISDDETVEASEDEETEGRGVRVRRRKRQEKRLRNEGRRQRRMARGVLQD